MSTATAKPLKIEAHIRATRTHHGDFTETARVSQAMKAVMRESVNWDKLTDVQRECLEMDAVKTARILSGDANHFDHWFDKVGYATLSIDDLP